MKNFFILFVFLLLPTISIADTFSGTVSGETTNLYKMLPQNKYIKTSSCNEVASGAAAILTLDTYTGQLEFTTSGTICAVSEVFDKFILPIALTNSPINVSSAASNWYALNNISTLEDNGKRVKTTFCSVVADQDDASLTANTDGIGSIYFSDTESSCNVSGIYQRIFEATDIWTVHDTDTSGIIDWLTTEHPTLNHASYLRINNMYFYVYASDTDSPLSGSGYSYATVLACNQLTGEPSPGPYDPTGPQWADLTNLVGENIEAFSSWQDITDLEINIDLRQGWNLVSVPLNNLWYVNPPPDIDLQEGKVNIPVPDLSEVLNSIAGQYELVRSIDEEGEKSYDPALPNDQNSLNYLSGGHGYWIKMNSPGTLTLTGRAPYATDSLQLHSGWNLIGHWGGDEKQVALSEGTSTYVADVPIEDVLSPIIDSVELVRGCDETGAKTYAPGIPDHLNTLHVFEAGKGYWVKLNQDQSIDFAP